MRCRAAFLDRDGVLNRAVMRGDLIFGSPILGRGEAVSAAGVCYLAIGRNRAARG